MNNFANFLYSDCIYNPDEIPEILAKVRTNFRFSQVNTKHKYFNVPAAFDIETSSFYDANGDKVGLMYVWMFGIYGCVIVGRTWEEFDSMINDLVSALDLDNRKRLIVYVHNLQFDFQFFRSHFHFEKVFAIDSRKPLYALTDSGIEFRCSFLLSGYSLLTLGKNLISYPVEKKAGDLDYELIRHGMTPLTSVEIGYCANDVKVVMSYIAEEIDKTKRGIAELPYTKTGYVRNYCRNECFYEDGKPRKNSKKRYSYMDIIRRCSLDPILYQHLRHGFTGGFTHANAIYSGFTCEHVSSYDFTSSYPAVMIAEKFPTGTPEKIDCTSLTMEDFEKYCDLYACLFTVHLYGLREKPMVYENYISASKCLKLEGAVINNGRVVAADLVILTITDVDWDVIKACYTWHDNGIRISDMYVWIREYLPTDFIKAILKLYWDKTTLKGVKGKESEYMVSKGMLNACYGMAVTNIIRKTYLYEDDWLDPLEPDLEAEIEKYNKQSSRFLYYPWGVWVTAYARRNLFTGILNAKEDYIYSDTDSIKLLNHENHKEYFETYNRMIVQKLEKAMDFHGLNKALIRPKTIKGVEKPLGVWDFEGIYKRFKTLGAKRYLIEKEDGDLELTVSGLNKNITVPHLKKRFANNDIIFEFFRDGLTVPAEATGKKTHTYIDQPRAGVITDYLGNTTEYNELSGLHLEGAEYHLTITQEYNDFLTQIWKGFEEIET